MVKVKAKPKICIGIPTSDYFSFPRPCAISFMSLFCHANNKGLASEITIATAASPMTAQNRSGLISHAWEVGADYHLQIDADMSFDGAVLERMIKCSEAHPDSIITGVGHVGHPPFHPALFRFDEKKETLVSIGLMMKDLPSVPFEVDTCGTFGMLIPRSVIEKMRKHFPEGSNLFAHMIKMRKDKTPLEIRHDFAFCLRAGECGIKVICEPSAVFDHCRTAPICWASWVGERDNGGEWQRDKILREATQLYA